LLQNISSTNYQWIYGRQFRTVAEAFWQEHFVCCTTMCEETPAPGHANSPNTSSGKVWKFLHRAPTLHQVIITSFCNSNFCPVRNWGGTKGQKASSRTGWTSWQRPFWWRHLERSSQGVTNAVIYMPTVWRVVWCSTAMMQYRYIIWKSLNPFYMQIVRLREPWRMRFKVHWYPAFNRSVISEQIPRVSPSSRI
jgi:hypothetical protein